MNVAELERLLADMDGEQFYQSIRVDIARSLVRRVIAAEKLVEAANALFEQASHVHLGGLIPHANIHKAAQSLGGPMAGYQKALTAYEATR